MDGIYYRCGGIEQIGPLSDLEPEAVSPAGSMHPQLFNDMTTVSTFLVALKLEIHKH